MKRSEVKAFGLYLRQLRERAGLTLREVEGVSRVSNGYVSLMERGLRNAPHPDILRRLAEAYAVPVTDLMRKAGYLEETDELLLADARLDQQYQHAISDPAFQYGNKVTGPVSKEIKRFVVELYQRMKQGEP